MVMDYCKGGSLEFRAIIHDQELYGSKMTTVYGSGKDSTTITTFKQVGYVISIFFLLLTLAIYCVIKEVRVVTINSQFIILTYLHFSYENICFYIQFIHVGIEWKNGYVPGFCHGLCLFMFADQNL